MQEIQKNEDLSFDRTQTVSDKGSAILGKLAGPCADIIHATRNGRKYNKQVWQHVFNDPIIKEYFEAGGIFGELGHPTDREETDMEKIAICMPHPPKDNSKGELIGEWDILDTPNGRILKCLCDYGYKIGISSRGSGDIETDTFGNESVAPSSYTLQAFDAVLLPAVKAARLTPVTESFNPEIKLRKALHEELNRATESEKEVMVETLNALNIDYTSDKVNSEEKSDESDDNIDTNTKVDAAVNNRADILEDLQTVLKEKASLEERVISLQKELSVSHTKESKLEEELQRHKTTVATLSTVAQSASALKERVSKLTEQLSDANNSVKQLQERYEASIESKKILSESLTRESTRVKQAQEDALHQKAQANKAEQLATQSKIALQEQLAEIKKDSTIKHEQYTETLNKQNKLIERYKTIAKTAVDKYILLQAQRIGVSSDEIKNRLSENYSFDEITKVCDSLQSYNISVSKLPFRTSLTEGTKVRVKKSNETIMPNMDMADDSIDSQLIQLAKIN